MELEDKIDIVRNILKGKKVALGFSGGADSTLLAWLSSQVAEDTLAVTVDNHLLPTGFAENTLKAAEEFKIRHVLIDIDFYGDEEFLTNDGKRCYNCRKAMYSAIETAAREEGFNYVCDGNNISDLVCDRPGILVTYSKGFQTPLIDARLTSAEIHEYLNRNGIGYSRSTTCLATRIPTGTPITSGEISKIRSVEDFISENTSCEIVKVRIMNATGICEVDEIAEILRDEKYKLISDKAKEAGFAKLCLNLSQIDDDEYIDIDYEDGSFAFQLPYRINPEDTDIRSDKITVHENGLVTGHGFESRENALDTFMKTLTEIRRKI